MSILTVRKVNTTHKLWDLTLCTAWKLNSKTQEGKIKAQTDKFNCLNIMLS